MPTTLSWSENQSKRNSRKILHGFLLAVIWAQYFFLQKSLKWNQLINLRILACLRFPLIWCDTVRQTQGWPLATGRHHHQVGAPNGGEVIAHLKCPHGTISGWMKSYSINLNHWVIIGSFSWRPTGFMVQVDDLGHYWVKLGHDWVNRN